MTQVCAACFDAPPEYDIPQRGPPVVTSALALPPVFSTYLVDPQYQIPIGFSVPFRAEDMGSPMQAIFWRDYDPLVFDSYKFLGIRNLDSSSLPLEEQTNRSVVFDWTFDTRLATGCHTVTMILTYVDNLDDGLAVRDYSLAAFVTWWFWYSGAEPDTVPVECSSIAADSP